MHSQTIIVGNGTSILDGEFGASIDSYESVIRFNNYGTRGYEKHAGSKTSIWFNVVNFLNKEHEWRMREPYERIVLHSWEWSPSKDKLFLEFKDFYKHKPENFIEKTKPEIIKEIQGFSGDSSYSGISTGLIAVWMMLKSRSSVDLVGFDWWNTDKHHYNDNAIRGTLHQPQKEKAILDKLRESGKVFFIN